MALPWATGGAPGQGGWLGIFPHLSSQERVNKKQKKAAPSEGDDSGVEVYYREGEEEIEETSVLPKVRDHTCSGREGSSGEGSPRSPASELGCLRPHPLLSHFL